LYEPYLNCLVTFSLHDALPIWNIRLGNAGDPSRLIIVVRGELQFDDDSDGSVIHGLVYTTGRLGLYDPYSISGSNVYTITGATTVLRDSYQFGPFLTLLINNVDFRTSYVESAVSDADFGSLCTPDPTVSIDNASAPQGEALSFTVSLSAPSPVTTTVNYRTTNGTAIAGTDYDGVSN